MIIHGITFDIDWDKFKPYSSFFIPCLDWEAAREVVFDECEKRGIPVVIRFSVEDNIRGIRTWRIKEEAAPDGGP
jgi:hypothetical protein